MYVCKGGLTDDDGIVLLPCIDCSVGQSNVFVCKSKDFVSPQFI